MQGGDNGNKKANWIGSRIQRAKSNRGQNNTSLQEALHLFFSGPTAEVLHQTHGLQTGNQISGMETERVQEVLHSSLRTEGSRPTDNLSIANSSSPGQQSNPYAAMNVPSAARISQGLNRAAELSQRVSSIREFQNNVPLPTIQTPIAQTPQVSASPPTEVQSPPNNLSASLLPSQIQNKQGHQVIEVKNNSTLYGPSQNGMTAPNIQPVQRQLAQQHNIVFGTMSRAPHPMQLQPAGSYVCVPSHCETKIVNASGQHVLSGTQLIGTNMPVYAYASGTGQPMAVMPPNNPMMMSTVRPSPLTNNISTSLQQDHCISTIQQQFQPFLTATQGCTRSMATTSQMQFQPMPSIIQQVGQVDSHSLQNPSAQAIAFNQFIAIPQSNFMLNGDRVPVTCTQRTPQAVQDQQPSSEIGDQQQTLTPLVMQSGRASASQHIQHDNPAQVPSLNLGQDINQMSQTSTGPLNSFSIPPSCEDPNRTFILSKLCQTNSKPMQSSNMQLNLHKNSLSNQQSNVLSISQTNLAIPPSTVLSSPNQFSANISEANTYIRQQLRHSFTNLHQTQPASGARQGDGISELLEVISPKGYPSESCNEMVSSDPCPSAEHLHDSLSFPTRLLHDLVSADSLIEPMGNDSKRTSQQACQPNASPRASQGPEGSPPSEPGRITTTRLSTTASPTLPEYDVMSFPVDGKTLSNFLGIPHDDGGTVEQNLQLLSSAGRAGDGKSLERENGTSKNVANSNCVPQSHQTISHVFQLSSPEENGIDDNSAEKESTRNQNYMCAQNCSISKSHHTTTSNDIELGSSDEGSNETAKVLGERGSTRNKDGSPNLHVSPIMNTNANNGPLNSPSAKGPISPDIGMQHQTLTSSGKLRKSDSEAAIEAWESYFDYDWTKIATPARRKRRANIVSRKRLPVAVRRIAKTMRNGDQPISFRKLTDDEVMEISRLYPRMARRKKEKKVRNRIVAQRGRERKRETTENLAKENEKLRSHCSSLQADNAELEETKAENARLKERLDKLLLPNPSLHSSTQSENSEEGDKNNTENETRGEAKDEDIDMATEETE